MGRGGQEEHTRCATLQCDLSSWEMVLQMSMQGEQSPGEAVRKLGPPAAWQPKAELKSRADGSTESPGEADPVRPTVKHSCPFPSVLVHLFSLPVSFLEYFLYLGFFCSGSKTRAKQQPKGALSSSALAGEQGGTTPATIPISPPTPCPSPRLALIWETQVSLQLLKCSIQCFAFQVPFCRRWAPSQLKTTCPPAPLPSCTCVHVLSLAPKQIFEKVKILVLYVLKGFKMLGWFQSYG